jgi:hypothetical protein
MKPAMGFTTLLECQYSLFSWIFAKCAPILDIGVYGTSTIPTYKGRDATLREFEKFTLEHGGYQVHILTTAEI